MIEKKYLISIIFLVYFTIVLAIISHYLLDEISNNVTLVVEVGVGIGIALVIYSISRESERTIENKITNMLGIIKKQEHVKAERESYVYSSLLSVLTEIQNETTRITKESINYEETKDTIEKRAINDQIILRCKKIRKLAEKNLDNSAMISDQFFDFDTLGLFRTISGLCKNEPNFDDEKIDVYFCDELKTRLEPRISELKNKIKTSTKEISPYEQPILQAKGEKYVIATSADRTVYPLGSAIHVRANLPFAPKNEIVFEVFNAKRKLLLSKHVDPTKPENPELAEGNIFEASFKMEGDEWKVGHTYIVRAKYEDTFSEDSFVVAQRNPVVQTDRSVYTINSDMLLTVIDADADRDNDVAEIIGDNEESKVTIESKYGKIQGYKLRETGNSTGIFQGIVGILGIRKDGSIIPRSHKGKIIDKIQGTGFDDGFIGASPGDEIIIRYKNSTSVSYMRVYLSNFGATVELDKKLYKTNDKIYLTIVAPDLNYDSNSIDEIGQNPESIVKIYTSIDKIDDYKLIETKEDTGIFVGELQLVKSDNTSTNNSNKHNSNKQRIFCTTDDFIEVTFKMFDNQEYVAKATIRE